MNKLISDMINSKIANVWKTYL